ncbi:MAG: Ig-like domain-containing protein, partial [Candidatus Latescibacteria bacterium]|nr:Ig-like domain-containing protein [Candidatus Latescibacterota bacterium]
PGIGDPSGGDQGGGFNFKPVAAKKQTGDPNQDFDPNFQPEPQGPFGETISFDEVEDGMSVAVFGEPDKEAFTVVATRITILFGGAQEQAFDITDRVDFYDQFGGGLNFEPPPLIFVQSPIAITLADGSQTGSLTDLRDFFIDLHHSPDVELNALRLVVDLLPTGDPNRRETSAVQVLGKTDADPTLGDNQRLIVVTDPFSQVRDFEGVISFPPKQGVRVTRNTEVVFADGSPADIFELNFGVRVHVTGKETVFPGSFDGERIADRIEIVGGEPFFIDALVESVDEASRTITLEADPPEPIDQRAYIGDIRGSRTTIAQVVDELASNADLELLVQFNPYGPGVIRLELVDPRFQRPFRPEDHIFPSFEVSIDVENRALVFNQKPPITVPEGTTIIDDEGNARQLAELAGNRIILDGEVIAGTPTALEITLIEVVGDIRLVVEVGDFDGGGAANDARLRVFEGDTENELGVPVQVFLDFFPPSEIKSGAVANNLNPGVHFLSIEVPSIPGLFAETEFAILARATDFTVVSTTPEDGATGVAEETTVSISFSQPIQKAGQFINVDVDLRPEEGVEVSNVVLTDGDSTVVATVKFQPATTYTLTVAGAVSRNGQGLPDPVTISFSTGAELAALGTITGKIDLAALPA